MHSRQARKVDPVEYQASGRMQAVLATAAPFVLVVPDHVPPHELSITLRIAHDLNKFHKIDSEIIRTSEVWQRCKDGSLGRGNVVIVGGGQTAFNRWCFAQQDSAFDLGVTPPKLNGKPLEGFPGVLSSLRLHLCIQ